MKNGGVQGVCARRRRVEPRSPLPGGTACALSNGLGAEVTTLALMSLPLGSCAGAAGTWATRGAAVTTGARTGGPTPATGGWHRRDRDAGHSGDRGPERPVGRRRGHRRSGRRTGAGGTAGGAGAPVQPGLPRPAASPAARPPRPRSFAATSRSAARSPRLTSSTGTRSRPRTRASGVRSRAPQERTTGPRWTTSTTTPSSTTSPSSSTTSYGARSSRAGSAACRRHQKAAVEDWIKPFCTALPGHAAHRRPEEPPPHTTPPYMAALGGAGASGYDWVVSIFKWARQYCPNSTLIVNDYNIIEQSGDNSHMIDLVNQSRPPVRRSTPSARRRTALYQRVGQHGADVHRQARHARRVCPSTSANTTSTWPTTPSRRTYAEPVHDVLERPQRARASPSGVTSREPGRRTAGS